MIKSTTPSKQSAVRDNKNKKNKKNQLNPQLKLHNKKIIEIEIGLPSHHQVM